jgi:hypothetical protein
VKLGDSGHFENGGLDRKHWKDAAAIRRIFKEAFQRADLPYFNPHSFRNTLVTLGEQICPTPEAFKAWSQNMGHAHVLTTLTSYGAVAQHRQDEILSELANDTRTQPDRRPLVVVEPERLERLEQMIAELRPKGAASTQPPNV